MNKILGLFEVEVYNILMFYSRLVNISPISALWNRRYQHCVMGTVFMDSRFKLSKCFTFMYIPRKSKKGSRITPKLIFLLNVAVFIFNYSINTTLVNNLKLCSTPST